MSRNLGIEFMRCLMMLLIVLHHCCYHGGIGGVVPGGISEMTMFCVDAFVFISGWYGIRLKWRKIVDFIALGMFYVLLSGIGAGISGRGWSFRFSLGWFGNCYLALMMVSPFLNAAIERLKEQGTRHLFSAWTSFAAIFAVSWMSCGWLDFAVEGWKSGHSFVTMCFVYMTARTMRLLQVREKCNIPLLAGVFAVSSCANLGLAWLRYSGSCNIPGGGGGYNSPFVMAMAIAAFLIFERLRLPDPVARLVTCFAPSMFGVYLMHDGVPAHWIRVEYSELIAWMMPTLGGIGTLFVVSFAVFAGCLTVDLLRRGVLSFVIIKKGAK